MDTVRANDEIEIDIKELFYVIRSKIVIIILAGIIGATIAGLWSSFCIKPLYTTSTKLYIVSKTSISTTISDLQLGTQLTKDYMVLVKSRPVVEQIIENLGLEMSYEGLVGAVSLENEPDTRILTIKITNPDPYLAKQIVDEFAKVSSTQISKIMDVQKPSIVEEGNVERVPSSPNVKKNIMLGGLIAMFLLAGIAVVIYLLDDTIKNADDVEKYLDLNTLGMIPVEEGGLKDTKKIRKKRFKK